MAKSKQPVISRAPLKSFVAIVVNVMDQSVRREVKSALLGNSERVLWQLGVELITDGALDEGVIEDLVGKRVTVIVMGQ